MTTPEEPRQETLAEAQQMLAQARPEQLRRLLADIRAAETNDRGDETPQRRAS